MRRIHTLLFVLLTALALSQDIKLNVSPSATRIGEADQLQLYVTVESNAGENVRVPSLPQAIENDWDVLNSSSSTSTNFSFGGGQTQSSKTQKITYFLRPKRKGKLTIPAVSLTHKGKQYSSKAMQIEVTQGSVAPTPNPARQSARSQPASNPTDEDAVFLSVYADKNSAYVGEPVMVTYTLYSQVNILQLSMSKEATYPGFWAEDFYNISKLEWRYETIKGKRYRAATIKKLVLYPGSSGKQTTTPMELDIAVQVASRSFFDFFGSSKRVTVKSKPLTIDVKPLPQKGQPSDFSGAVGDFQVSMEADQNQCQANNAISVKISVTGTGNVKSIDKIEPTFPKSFEIYGESENERIVSRGDGTRQKTFEYVVIPREKGNFEIPPVSIPYFDTRSGSYKRATSSPMPLNILQGEEGYAQGGVTMLQKDDVISVGKDIGFIKTDIPTSFDTLKRPSYTFIFILFPLLGLVIVMAFLIKKNRLRLYTDSSYARFVNAHSKAASRVKRAGKDKLLSEVADALEAYIADKLDVSIGELSPEEIEKKLIGRGVSNETASEASQFQSQLDMARFAPGAARLSEDEARERAMSLMKRLEKEVKR